MGVAAEQLKKNGLSKGGMLNLKKPALQPAGRESFHQGAVRFQDQDQACFQDCACVGHEEDEGGHQLNAVFGGFGRGYTELQFILHA